MEWKIRTVKWDNKNVSYYGWDTARKYKRYKGVPGPEYTVEAQTLDDAYRWLLTNHPIESIGCCIEGENGDFLIDAVLDYYAAEYGTTDLGKIADLQLSLLRK